MDYVAKAYHSHVSMTPDDRAVAVNIRFDGVVHRALVTASATSGRSMNSLVNEAVASYLSASTPQPNRRGHYEDTIRKLAGE